MILGGSPLAIEHVVRQLFSPGASRLDHGQVAVRRARICFGQMHGQRLRKSAGEFGETPDLGQVIRDAVRPDGVVGGGLFEHANHLDQLIEADEAVADGPIVVRVDSQCR